jgi:hypothetical protein
MDEFALNKNEFAKEIVDDIKSYLQSHKREGVNIEEYCEKKLKEKYKNFNVLKLGELSAIVVNRVKEYFHKEIDEARTAEIIPDYEFAFLDIFIYRYDTLKENGLSFIREYKGEILGAMHKMGWRNFEFLCKHLLEINGVIAPDVTPKGKEGGIDFYGLLELDKSSKSIFFKGGRIRIVGQAKCYKGMVGEGEIINFNDHSNNLSKDPPEGRAVKKLPLWFTRLKAPILKFFITTGKFTKDAKKYAERNSIVLKNGREVIEVLIKSPRAKEWFSQKEGKLFFNERLFIDFFKK